MTLEEFKELLRELEDANFDMGIAGLNDNPFRMQAKAKAHKARSAIIEAFEKLIVADDND